jgi:outer membrane protein OmpA-like peptidoglycan-associated protein
MSSGDKRHPHRPTRGSADTGHHLASESTPAAPHPRAHGAATSHGTSAGTPLFLQRKVDESAETPHAAPHLDGVLNVAQSTGLSLDAATQDRMEEQLGQNFDDVRVHTGDAAAGSAKDIGARAYTAGRDVVFGGGEFTAGTRSGDRLLAHELTHVIQQTRGAHAGGGGAPTIGGVDDSMEREANKAAEPIGDSSSAAAPASRVSAEPTPVVQRDPLPGQLVPPVPELRLRPPPMLARSLGSLTIDAFALNSPHLTSEHQSQLARLAATIIDLVRDYPGGSLTLVGHADLTGEDDRNQTLGQERADAALAELAANGVPREMMSASSAGESAPVVPTRSAEARNRRVEIRFEPEMRFHVMDPAQLTLRGPEPFTPPPPPPQLDPKKILQPPVHPETIEERLNRILKEAPPTAAEGGTSIGKAARDKLDEGLNHVMEKVGVPKSVRPYVRDAAHKALEKGAHAVLDQVMTEAGLGSEAQDAIRHAVDAAVETPIPSGPKP